MEDNLKLCVYAICKNESKFVDRWINGLKDEADCVVVLDTGSTDDTVEKLKKYEPFVNVHQFNYVEKFGEFRFDKARNDSLKLVPFDVDICVILDLDHVPRPGWAGIIKDEYKKGNKEVYGYIVDHSIENGDLSRWVSKNVHPNIPGYVWTNMIHEGIDYIGTEKIKDSMREDFIIDHYPDDSKDRSGYRRLLEKAVAQEPDNPYYSIYLGVELSRRYSTEEAYKAFKNGLEKCNFEGKQDLYYQFLLNTALYCPDKDEALDYLYNAMDTGIKTRRVYKLLADIYEELGRYDNAINSLLSALTITDYAGDWRDDYNLYNGYIEDRLSLFYYYQKNNYLKAIEYCTKALAYNPKDARLNSNLDFYYEKFKSTIRSDE